MRLLAASRASSRREISACSPALEPASRCSSAMRSSSSLIGRSKSRITSWSSREEPQQPFEVALEGEPVHDPVYHPVFLLELRSLEALRQPLLGGLLYDPPPREPNPGPRLGDDDVSSRRE